MISLEQTSQSQSRRRVWVWRFLRCRVGRRRRLQCRERSQRKVSRGSCSHWQRAPSPLGTDVGSSVSGPLLQWVPHQNFDMCIPHFRLRTWATAALAWARLGKWAMKRAEGNPFELLGYDCHLLKLEGSGPRWTTAARNETTDCELHEFNLIVQIHGVNLSSTNSILFTRRSRSQRWAVF